MLRTSDLLRIVVRRQLRQLRIGVILSIGIGIAMFIGVNVVGKDVEERITQDVSLIGNVTIIMVEHEEYMHPAMPPQFFTPKTISLLRGLPEVYNVSACMRWAHQVPMQIGDRTFYLYVLGVDPQYWDVYSLYALEGRLLNAEDEQKRSRVCVLGEEAARNLLGEGPYVGRELTIYSDNYTVVGISGGFMMHNRADRCFIPLSTAFDRTPHDNKYPNRILVRMHHLDDVEPMEKKLPDLIRSQQKAPYLKVEYPKDAMINVRTIIARVHVLLMLGIIAALGLGGFGIWQSSFASVRDRTREIGLKLAMGAERKDIMLQFLGEALFSALLGGMAGIVAGVAAVLALCFALGLPVPLMSIFLNIPLCLLAATLVGAGGGTYPAMQAGRMDVAAALRFE